MTKVNDPLPRSFGADMAADLHVFSTGGGITLVSAAFFALNTPFAALFYGFGGDPLILMAARTAAAGLLAAALAAWLRRTIRLAPQHRKPIIIATVAQFVQGACYLGSVAFIPVSLAALIFFTWPILVALAAPLAGDRRPPAKAFGLFALAFLGLALALGPDLERLDIHGIGLAVAGAFSVAAYLLMGRSALREVSATSFAIYTNLGTTVLATVVWFIVIGKIDWATDPSNRVDAITVMLVVCGVYSAGIVTQLWALRRAAAPVLALLFNLEPVLSILAAGLLLGEVLQPIQLIGGVIIVTSLIAYSWISSTDQATAK